MVPVRTARRREASGTVTAPDAMGLLFERSIEQRQDTIAVKTGLKLANFAIELSVKHIIDDTASGVYQCS
jgi:hypothetical protein